MFLAHPLARAKTAHGRGKFHQEVTEYTSLAKPETSQGERPAKLQWRGLGNQNPAHLVHPPSI